MAEVPNSSLTSELLHSHGDLYKFATHHPFILSIRDGTVNSRSFQCWLGQDYLFVRAFVRFAASVLLKCPDDKEHLDTILGGLAALSKELEWFREEAAKWDVDLDSLRVRSSTQEYIELLEELTDQDTEYAVAVAALWCIEAVYSDSFQACLEPGSQVSSELLPVCQRWGSEEFKSYVNTIRHLADTALESERPHVKKKARLFFVQILTQEVSFWNMAVDETE
eukprot:TRINITY_DN16997_c0_g1_i1.p1 TRINITY_DN16997_c0_g1~~TRINITY_DN16997_c0_g1_i1.p1  ORF type:complete len:223 (-),score=31.86 TRINITY_DN16997_c0_g1_i1:264-932(-)